MPSALTMLFVLAPAFAASERASELLPAESAYQRNAECSEVSPPAIFFENGQPGPSSSSESPLSPPEGLRTPFAQGEADFCFAYASAELVSQRTGTVVAPLDIATTYYYAPLASFVRSLVDRGMTAQEAKGIAAKIRSDRQDVSIMNPKGKPEVGYIDYIAGGDESSALLMANAKDLCPADQLNSDQGFSHHSKVLEEMRSRSPAHRGRVPVDSPFSRDPRASAVNAAWVGYVEQQCHRVPSPVLILPVQFSAAKDLAEWRDQPKARKREAHQPLFSRIDYALDNGRTPIVGIDWYIFEDPDGTDGDHAITVVGRKKVNGTCHYLLRDNVNEPCENLHDKFVPRCRNGHVWVTEAELAETMYSVTYLR